MKKQNQVKDRTSPPAAMVRAGQAEPVFAPEGLTEAEAGKRLKQFGLNETLTEKPLSPAGRLAGQLKNPLVALLAVLGGMSLFTGDIQATVVIGIMLLLSIFLRFFQELRADKAAEKLKALVSTHARVIREGTERDLPARELVPGDLIVLGAGDIVPADARILSAKDLFVNQAALTGESLPVEKRETEVPGSGTGPTESASICFQASNVVSGSARARITATGNSTYFGQIAGNLTREQPDTAFDKGINRFTWLIIRFILVMVPVVFLINGIVRHDWTGAFLFALAVAVGLTPEMLPMIVSVNLSKGALAMSEKKVIVRRLDAIQNFGAMDVLCTDKTGTLTVGRIVLEQHLDTRGHDSRRVLDFGYLNSYHQTGLRNIMDEAILNHEELEEALEAKAAYRKIDEIPFDFERKRMSVVVEDKTGLNLLICKGAAEAVLGICSRIEEDGVVRDMLPEDHRKSLKRVHRLNSQGFRVLALAYRYMPGASDERVYGAADEKELVLLGYLSFFDPPRESAPGALRRLRDLQVEVKILTGDNEAVTACICGKVGLPSGQILCGPEIGEMSDSQLRQAVGKYTVFARLFPDHKKRIIEALQQNGHVTGFLGDGINDAPALKAADIGISVDGAADVAKESSDIILLENSLMVLGEGVAEGRRVFGNIIKYIRMAASSNFGNMLSVAGASAFLPFLPMLPIQVLTNNLLYDFSQTTIPTDRVDEDWLLKPRKWAIAELQRFILIMGPVSSVFDFLTFFVLFRFLEAGQNEALFRTGWFVESIFTQTLIIHIIRTPRIPFLQSMPSPQLLAGSLLVVMAGAWLTVSPLAGILGFVTLPPLYWLLLAGILVLYAAATQLVKSRLLRGEEAA